MKSEKEFKKLDEHLYPIEDVAKEQEGLSAPEMGKDGEVAKLSAPKMGQDGDVAKLTTAVTMLASRMEDMLGAQAEIQKELLDVKAAIRVPSRSA